MPIQYFHCGNIATEKLESLRRANLYVTLYFASTFATESQRKKRIYFELKIYLSTSLEEEKESKHRDNTAVAIQERTQTQDPAIRGMNVSKLI